MLTVAYKDKSLPVSQRVDDLLRRMTLAEKVGQMVQLDARKYGVDDAIKGVGSFLFAEKIDQIRQLQDAATKQTRLGIPIVLGIDAIHGYGVWPGGTVFPSQLGISCSWSTELCRKMAAVTAREMSATGQHWTFSPVLCMARDLRWGRVDETFGEDGLLIGDLAVAMIEGYQGGKLSDRDSVLACAKHFVGYGLTEGGRDATESDHSRRKILSLFAPPFVRAVAAKCATFMTAYHAIDGVPCSANRWLLTETLKEQWGFDGFVVTDWDNVGHMHKVQFVSPTLLDAAVRAIKAGNDMMMSRADFPELAVEAVQKGLVGEKLIDEACLRILRVKFELGLFDDQSKIYPDATRAAEILGCDEHRDVALESARESIVLLKNEGGALPLAVGKLRSIAVVGPNADNVEAHLGDWAYMVHDAKFGDATHARKDTVTILDGLRKLAGDSCRVDYARGCAVYEKNTEERWANANPTTPGEIDAAVELARSADAAIVVVGDSLALNGETHDRANLDLSANQQMLLEKVRAVSKKMIVVLLCAKPLSVPWIKEHADAILLAFNPGMLGGQAIAEAIFGQINPSGKLTISWPVHVGQQPVWYNQLPGWHGGPPQYVDMSPTPLWRFGVGLSYTKYKYDNLRLASRTIRAGEDVRVSVDVTNIGPRDGVEIVQCYVNDVYSSLTTPIKELKAYRRAAIAAGKKATVEMEIPFDSLSLVDENLRRVVEPGKFEIMVGPSSDDADLLKDSFEVAIDQI